MIEVIPTIAWQCTASTTMWKDKYRVALLEFWLDKHLSEAQDCVVFGWKICILFHDTQLGTIDIQGILAKTIWLSHFSLHRFHYCMTMHELSPLVPHNVWERVRERERGNVLQLKKHSSLTAWMCPPVCPVLFFDIYIHNHSGLQCSTPSGVAAGPHKDLICAALKELWYKKKLFIRKASFAVMRLLLLCH